MIGIMDKGSIKIDFNKCLNFLSLFGFVLLLSSSVLLGKSELDRHLNQDNADKKDLRSGSVLDDLQYLRKLSVDLIGRIPSEREIKQFLKDPPKNRKALLVERLFGHERFADRWTAFFADMLRIRTNATGGGPLLAYVHQSISEDKPFDKLARELISAQGKSSHLPAVGFILNDNADPMALTAATAQVFLGIRMQCAQCHDHFYDPISQKEYYQLVAFFNNTPDEMGKSIGAGRSAMTGPTVKVGDASTFVMQEMQKKRTSQIFLRGNYETKGEKVLPKVPGFLHPPDQEAPDNRLGLAQWLVDPENPLTPRVTVNRWWSEIFGTGLVRTGADFGTQGEAPSHPDLLDWLAVDFVEQNWSMKKLLKQIVLSSTYAQSPRISPANKTKDPQNLLLGRFPKLRLSAEAIRDNALRISGLLTPALGGPPAYPPQPDGIWWIRDDKSPRYVTSTGEQRYRRSLYTIWRRTYLHPTLSNFDAPNRVTCSADRERTNTPLQALTLMNDPIFLEAGFGLARRMYDRSKSHSIKDAIRFGFCLSTTRNPDQTETDALSGLYEKSLRNFSKDGDSAYKLLNSVRGELALGVSPLNASEVALLTAWFQVANVLLNLDETISKG